MFAPDHLTENSQRVMAKAKFETGELEALRCENPDFTQFGNPSLESGEFLGKKQGPQIDPRAGLHSSPP